MSPFVHVCGVQLCLSGRAFPLFGASVLRAGDDPARAVHLALDAGLNTVRLVNFLDESGDPATAPFDPARWRKVDRVIADARAAQLHVILDLSTYRNMLQRHRNPYTADWGSFLRWVAGRRNTVTGLVYRSDPTIALVSLAGEPDAPMSSEGKAMGLTTAELTAFYARTAREWKTADPNHLLSPGGFLYLDWNSGIDWRAIGSIPALDVFAIHVYSVADQTKTLPAVSGWAASHRIPWIVEEFGQTQGMGDRARASYFAQVIRRARAAHAAAVAFWNLGDEVAPVSHDVGPVTVLTWSVVRALG